VKESGEYEEMGRRAKRKEVSIIYPFREGTVLPFLLTMETKVRTR